MLKDILGNQKNLTLSPENWGKWGSKQKVWILPLIGNLWKNGEIAKNAYFDILSPFKCNHLKNDLAYLVGNFARNTMMLSILFSILFFMEL